MFEESMLMITYNRDSFPLRMNCLVEKGEKREKKQVARMWIFQNSVLQKKVKDCQ